MLEYERLEQNDLFSTIKWNTILGNTVTALAYSMRSLLRHVDDIVNNIRIVNIDIIGFTETRIQPLGSKYKRIKTLNFFNINFNNN